MGAVGWEVLSLGGLVHAYASCCDCDWERGTRNANALAAIHHKETGHEVVSEWAYAHTYGGVE